jgi:hypothetical protein
MVAASRVAKGAKVARAAGAGMEIGPGNPLGIGKAASGGPHVLENTKLNNAGDLFRALYGGGGQGSQAAQQATQQTAATQASQVANQAAQQTAASAGAAPTANVGGSGPGAGSRGGGGAAGGAGGSGAGSGGSAGASSPPPPPPPPGGAGSNPGSTPPNQPSAKSWLDRAADQWRQMQAQWATIHSRYTPVDQQTAGMSVDQRYQRLGTKNALPNIGDVAKQYGTPNPSREQIVQHGENEEERQRQQDNESSKWNRIGQSAHDAGKSAFKGAMSLANPATALIKVPAAAYGVVKAFEQVGRTISETNRDLRKFDERIADSFARYDYAQLRSRQKVAQATGGSAAFLNDQLKALLEEVQPLTEGVVSFLNVAGGSLTFIARALALIIKWNPAVWAMMQAAKKAEEFMGKAGAKEAQAAGKDFLRAIRDGNFKMPKNPKP